MPDKDHKEYFNSKQEHVLPLPPVAWHKQMSNLSDIIVHSSLSRFLYFRLSTMHQLELSSLGEAKGLSELSVVHEFVLPGM